MSKTKEADQQNETRLAAREGRLGRVILAAVQHSLVGVGAREDPHKIQQEILKVAPRPFQSFQQLQAYQHRLNWPADSMPPCRLRDEMTRGELRWGACRAQVHRHRVPFRLPSLSKTQNCQDLFQVQALSRSRSFRSIAFCFPLYCYSLSI